MSNFLKKNFTAVLLSLIIILAVFLRFYQLGSNPPSLDWDEASLGYNAYSILKTGADEYGNKFPLSIRSFDDYKPPLYVYLAIPSIAVFGLTESAIRFPSALLGSLTVLIVYFLVKELFPFNNSPPGWKHQISASQIALLTSFFFAISPWSLQFSRAAFEGNIGLFLFSSGTLFFLKGLSSKKFLILSSLFFVFSLYSYHSFRLLVPIFILLLLLVFKNKLLDKKRFLIIFIGIFFFLSVPVFQSFFKAGGSGSRLSMVTIFEDKSVLDSSIKQLEYDRSKKDFLGQLFHNRRIVYSLVIVKGYLDHWNPDFLFLHGDGGRQHHAVNMGMLYLFDLPFILIGIFVLLRQINKNIFILFLWFLIAPIASSITTGTPHPVRAIAMSLPFSIFSALGVIYVISLLALREKIYGYFVALLIGFFLLLNIFYYFHQYYVHTPITYGDFWQYGHKEAFKELSKLEQNFDKVIFTYAYDQPYIYYLFYNRIDPLWYQKNWDYKGDGSVERMRRIIGKYEFRNINWGEDQKIKNAIIVGTPREIPEKANIIKEIKFLDGSTAFRIVKLGL